MGKLSRMSPVIFLSTLERLATVELSRVAEEKEALIDGRSEEKIPESFCLVTYLIVSHH